MGRATELVFLLACGATMVIGGAAAADTLGWDPNFSGVFPATGGSGTWDIGTTANWVTSSGTPAVTFAEGDSPVFAGTTGGTVTVNATGSAVAGVLSSAGMVITANGYSFSGANLALTAPVEVRDAGETATINNTIASALTTQGAGNLILSGGVTGAIVTSGSGGSVTLQAGTFSGPLTMQGDTDVTLATNANLGTVTVNDGVLTTGTGTNLIGNVTFNGGGHGAGETALNLNGRLNGTLSIQDGGIYTIGDGTTNFLTGTLTVNDADAVVNSVGIRVYEGDVTVTAGAFNTVSGTTQVNQDVDIAGTLTLGPASLLTMASGTLTNTGTMTLNQGYIGEGTGGSDAVIVNTAAAVLGSSGGSLHLAAQYTQTGGKTTVANTVVVRTVNGPTHVTQISGGEFEVGAAGVFQTGAGGMTVSGSGFVDLDGQITGNVSSTSTAQSDFAGTITGTYLHQTGSGGATVTGNSSIGSVDLRAGLMTVNAGRTLTSAGGVAISGGTYDQNGTLLGDLTVSGALGPGGTAVTIAGDVTGSVTLPGGITTFDGTSTVTGPVSASGGIISIATGATLTAQAGVQATGTGFFGIDSGTLNGNLTLEAGGGARSFGGTINGDVVMNDGSMDLASFVLTVDGDVTVGTNSLLLKVSGNSALVLSGPGHKLTSRGRIVSGLSRFDITADEVELRAGHSQSGDVNYITNLLDFGTGGSIDLNASSNFNLEIQAGSTVNVVESTVVGTPTQQADGITDIVNHGTLNVVDSYDLTTGSYINNGTMNIGVGSQVYGVGNTYTNNGIVNIADLGVISDAGAVINTATGTINFAGDASVTADDDNDETVTVQNAGTWNLNGVAGDTVTVAVGGDDTAFENTGTVDVGVATLDVTGTTGLANSGAGVLDMAGGQITGDVTNTSTAAQSFYGTITGTYAQTGAAVGTTINGEAAINTVDVEAGGFTVNQSARLTSAGGVTVDGTGIATIAGVLRGDLTLGGTGTHTVGNATGLISAVSGSVTLDFDLRQVESTSTVNMLSSGGQTWGTVANDAGTMNVTGGTFVVWVRDAVTNAGTLNIDSGLLLDTADLTNTGTMTVTGRIARQTGDNTVTNTGSGVANLGGLIVADYVQDSAAAQTTVIGDTTVSRPGGATTGDVSITAGSLAVNSGVSLTYQSLTLASGATLTANGAMVGQSNTATTVLNGVATYNAGSSLTDAGSITIGATGSVTFDVAAGAISFDADSDTDGTGVFTNDGTIVVTGTTGTVSWGAGAAGFDDMTNQGTGTIDVQGGTVNGIATLFNTSTGDVAGTVGVTDAIHVANGATLGFTTLDSSAGTVFAEGTLSGNALLSGASGLILRNGGTLTGTLGLSGTSTFDIDGTSGAAPVEVAGAVTYDSTAASTLAGDLGATLDQNAGTITVDGTSAIAGAVTVDGLGTAFTVANDVDLTASAGITVGGSAAGAVLTVNGSVLGGGITNTNGTVLLGDAGGANTVIGGAVVQTAGVLTMTAGNGSSQIDIQGALTVTEGDVNIVGGVVTADSANIQDTTGGNGIFNIGSAGTLATDTGAISLRDQVLVAAGNAGVSGGLSAATGLDLIGAASSVTFTNGGILNAGGAGAGVISNDGVITVNGGAVASVGADALTNTATGRVVVNGGSLSLNGGALTSTSTLNGATPAVDIATGAVLTVSAVNMTGAGGELEVDGQVAGTVAITGTDFFDINGGVGGTVEVTGGVTQGGTSLLNTLAGDIGGVLSQTAAGRITVDGASSAGSFDNAAGTLRVDANLTVAGASSNAATLDLNATILGGQTITNSGTATLAGTIVGDYTQTARTTFVDGVSDVTGAITFDGGSLTVDTDQSLTGGSVAVQNAAVSILLNGASAGNATVLASDTTMAIQGSVLALNGGHLTAVGQLTNDGLITFNTTSSDGLITGSSVVNQRTITVIGGTTATNNVGIVLDGATSDLRVNGLVSAATLDLGTGSVTDTGAGNPGDTLLVAASANGATLIAGGGVTLDGGGDILMSGSGTAQAQITGAVSVDNGSNLTMNSAAFTARVAGDVSVAGTSVLDVNGTVGGVSEITGTLTVTSSALTNQFTGEIDTNLLMGGTGTLTIDGVSVVAGTTTVTDGTLEVAANATLTGGILVDGGSGADTRMPVMRVVLGTVTDTQGALVVRTTATAPSDATLYLAGDLTRTTAGDALVLEGGSAVINDGGAPLVTVTGNMLVTSGTAAFSGNTRITGGLTVNGAVTGLDEIDVAAGVVVQAASIDLNQTVQAGDNVAVGAGSVLEATTGPFTNATQIEVADGGRIGSMGTFTNEAGGQIVFANGGILSAGDISTGAAASGVVSNLGQIDVLGGLVSDAGTDTLSNAGTITLAPGATLSFGVIDNLSVGTIAIGAGATLAGTANTHTNSGLETIAAGGTITDAGAINNTASGTFRFDGAMGSLISGTGAASNITNLGSIRIAQGNLQQTVTATATGASFVNSGTIALADGETGDVLAITGDAVLNGTIAMDVNISGAMQAATAGTLASAADTGDRVTVSGTATGAPDLALSNVNAVYSSIGTPITLVAAADTTGLTPTKSGLPVNASYVYNLNNTGTQIQLTSTANLGYGGIASGLAATQSLISTVVNRPSSALVTPLVNPGDDPCAIGTWGRITGGRADASLQTTSSTSPTPLQNDIAMRYRGLQLGFDKSCSGGFYDGWDLAYGAMLGTNAGDTDLPVTFGGVSTNLRTEFDQLFGGVYLSAAKGNWFGDLNLRADRTTYSLNETAAFGAGGLGIEDQKFDSHGRTVSGSLSYTHLLNAEKAIRLVPTLGFSFSRVTTDAVQIENDPTITADDATLQVNQINQKIGFVGATLARTYVAPSGDAASTYFVTGTYFKDFGGDLTSTFTVKGTGVSQVLTSENLGGFGELSLGMNYTKLLNKGSALPARQLDASVRVDSRFSDNLDSWGITGQVRLQF